MAPVGKQAIEHFTHPGHILSELKAETLFLCDGCKTQGQGTRYRCDPCDFDLHDYCGSCPRSLSSFMHPHPLNLVIRKAQATRQKERICDVCRDPVEGLFYRCSDCEFDAHPLCTQLPQHLRHALHQVHPLTLQAAAAATSRCAVCGGGCSSWRYRCGACGFDIHIECVLAPCDPPKQHQAPPPWGPSRSAPPPHYRAPPWGPSPPPSPYQSPPAAYGGGYVPCEVPWGYNANYNMYGNGNLQPQTEGKAMYAVVGKLIFGVVSNVIFGTPGIDFSSFL